MGLREKWLKDSKLYVILDAQVNDDDKLFEIAKISVHSGVDILQVRDKFGSARDILKLLSRIQKIPGRRIPVLVNDRLDLALASGAPGVHLGQEDIPIKIARKMMGSKAIIGASCQTWSAAINAEREGADYIGFGSVFKTMTKPDRLPMPMKLLAKIYRDIQIPVFAIGGINLENIDSILSIGVDRVAVCRAICEAENVSQTIKLFKGCLSKEVFCRRN
ncbi:MAG TPA: thiamine phosphate synthase [Candidatus Omnitrophica bacterium]|nr:MAG: thiamine-phosphate diphosphorylase [Omnitrophica WOR_2 bacterium GWA2_45_18]OGX19639.1 MAG: thiamine-phosphate diphosphorylase [Omnitrophica WOR_2 bacterium GWC2_45_7]HBR14687.1 thiamine phosphate synthase [Candidatus Omnitrophota bacterium]